jgi:hypothetical protein
LTEKNATPHREKILAAIRNPKSKDDLVVLNEAMTAYDEWARQMNALTVTGKERVFALVALLDAYKNYLEVELIMKRGSAFLKRQKGQLKLDNSVMEEFLIQLVRPEILTGLGNVGFVTGPQQAFMSLSFQPRNFEALDKSPEVIVKTKDQDFVIGTEIHYEFSKKLENQPPHITRGTLVLAVLAAECKVNLDKTMFQEAAGTAGRLKQGCPVAAYYLLVEYLDMTPEDCRLTAIDNVFLLRRAKRLPFEKRDNVEAVLNQRRSNPLDPEVVLKFVEALSHFVNAQWYDPDEALRRGSFI